MENQGMENQSRQVFLPNPKEGEWENEKLQQETRIVPKPQDSESEIVVNQNYFKKRK